MEIKEIKAEGLSREYFVSVPSEMIKVKVDAVITKQAETFKMPGFREGKVPLSLVKRQIGAEVLQKQLKVVIDEALNGVFKHADVKPAMAPKIEVQSYDEENGLKLNVKFEALPAIPEIDFSQISIAGYDIEANEKDMERARVEIFKRLRNFVPMEPGYAASSGDIVKIDCVGQLEGVEFAEGTRNNIQIEIGSNQFMPGFEEHLVGVVTGEEKVISLRFPDHDPRYGGKDATFEVKVKEVMHDDSKKEWNEDLAKKLGFESLAKLEQVLMERMNNDFALIARFHIKKELFDHLDNTYHIDIPQNMLEADFQHVLKDVQAKRDPNLVLTEEEEAVSKEECKAIAARRVKLGLLLADIARNNNLTVTENDLKETIEAQVMRMPDKKKEIIDHYNKPENLKSLEGPIIEEKTVDFILTKIRLEKTKISAEEFSNKGLAPQLD